MRASIFSSSLCTAMMTLKIWTYQDILAKNLISYYEAKTVPGIKAEIRVVRKNLSKFKKLVMEKIPVNSRVIRFCLASLKSLKADLVKACPSSSVWEKRALCMRKVRAAHQSRKPVG